MLRRQLRLHLLCLREELDPENSPAGSSTAGHQMSVGLGPPARIWSLAAPLSFPGMVRSSGVHLSGRLRVGVTLSRAGSGRAVRPQARGVRGSPGRRCLGRRRFLPLAWRLPEAPGPQPPGFESSGDEMLPPPRQGPRDRLSPGWAEPHDLPRPRPWPGRCCGSRSRPMAVHRLSGASAEGLPGIFFKPLQKTSGCWISGEVRSVRALRACFACSACMLCARAYSVSVCACFACFARARALRVCVCARMLCVLCARAYSVRVCACSACFACVRAHAPHACAGWVDVGR